LRLLNVGAGLEVEAFGIVGTLLAQAVARIALDKLPHRRKRTKLEVAAAAIVRFAGPAQQRVELIERALIGEERQAAFMGDLEAALADIVASPLDQEGGEFLGHHALQERNVLADELFLQADGVRRDDDATIGGRAGGLDGWDEVGEALADAGAGLDHEMP